MNEASLKRIPTFTIEPENGYFAITGRSYPENVSDVYKPMLEAMSSYVANPKNETTLDLRFEFCSTSSCKTLTTLFELLEDIVRANPQSSVAINWYCEEEDEDKFELGEDLQESTELPFQIIMTE